MKLLACIAMFLVIVGAINWGLVGVGGHDWNMVFKLCDAIAGEGKVSLEDGKLDVDIPGPGSDGMYLAEKVVYIAVGVSGLFLAFGLVTKKKVCCS